jgi:histidinol-phosphate aminotransferase
MSKFLIDKFKNLTPYTPGEQPKERKYVKLNTNESPFPPSQAVIDAINKESVNLNLYSDPTASSLVKTASEFFKINENQIVFNNGSDESLYFSFMAFFNETTKLVFPEFTYGFYEVFADLLKIPYEKIPINSDFTINVNDYIGVNKNIVIANPNAPTGALLPLTDIEKIVASNPNNVVIIDEAYIDFGGETALPLINKYNNLLVIRTFSKSASLAGGRLGFAVGNEELTKDINTIRFSTNPYNVNRLTLASGVAVFNDYNYYKNNCKTIIRNREFLTTELEKLGFNVVKSHANFVFASSNKISGESLYLKLKERGILVRYFNKEKIKNYVRITIGSKSQLNALLEAVNDILKD